MHPTTSADSNDPPNQRPSDFAAPIPLTHSDFREALTYQMIGQAVQTSLERFLETLQIEMVSTSSVASKTRQDFFPKFFNLANRMADECCQELVKIVRASSRNPAVREAPTPALARRIRDTAFDSLDQILVSYGKITQKISIVADNIRKVEDQMKGSAAARPAAVKPDRGLSNLESANAPRWANDEELARQHVNLRRTQSQAFARIMQYLQTVEQLPESVLAYACDKCFPGQVDFELLRAHGAEIKQAIHARLGHALESMGQADLKSHLELQRELTRILSDIAMEKTQVALERLIEKRLEEKSQIRNRLKKIGLGILIVLFSFALGVWILMQML